MTNIFQTDLIKGLTLTIRYFFSKPVTLRYPEEYYDLPERFRGGQILKRHEDGKERCVGCCLCAAICPSDAIFIETSEGEDHEKVVDRYDIDMGLCIYCGYCQDVCPVDAVFMGDDYELTLTDPGKLRICREKMLTKGDDPRYDRL
jgi:NADH dehydrogenase (ubiquinone) Fe-S protein 8